MAIFRPQRAVSGIPYGIFETPGKLYIEGQAHDATTLAPIFNDTTVMGNTVIIRGAAPLIPMKSKQYFVTNTNGGGFGATIITDSTYFDNNQGIASNVKAMTSKADTLAVSQTVWGSNIVPTTLVNSKTGNQIGTFPAFTTGFSDGHSTIIYESSSSLISYTQHTGQNGGSNSTGASANYKVVSTNSNTGVSTTVLAMNTTNSVNAYGSVVHESPTDFFFITSTASSPSLLSATQVMNVISKTNVVTSFTLPARTNQTPAYRPTKAVTVSDTKRIVYLPELTGNSTGDLFKFSTYEINTAASTTAPVHVSVTPTNATTMMGTATSSANMLYRAWAFVENDFIYINVGCFQPTGTSVGIENNYIHTYKASVATPKDIAYVTSTQMHSSQRAHGAFPIDEEYKNLVIPYVGQGLDFFIWNSGSQSYIRTNSALMDAAYMMVDQTGRLWVTDTTNNLHVYSQTISNSIKVGFQNSNLRYMGTVLNSNLIVSAFNFKGERVANNVTLQIDSSSATFADGTNTMTITTLTTGDTLVPIKITGAGYIRVVSNLAI